MSAIPISAGEPNLWSAYSDGGNAPAVSAGEPDHGRPTVKFVYQNKKGYGNSRLDISLPPESYGVSFRLLVEEADPAATMHLWLFEADGDAWMCRIQPEDGQPIPKVKGVWRDVLVPFSALNHQGRGDKKRNFLSVTHMLMGFNFADQTVRIADLSLCMSESVGVVPIPDRPVELCIDPPGRRIAILNEPGFPTQPGHAEPRRLMKLLREAGFSPIFLSATDLVDPSRFSREIVDLLVIPCAPTFPAPAAPNFRTFLKEGGAFFSTGGYAFDNLVVPDQQGWRRGASQQVAAKDIDKDRSEVLFLNTRYGKHGDTMRLHRDQIGVFDPSFLLRNVASVKTSADQFVLPKTWQSNMSLEGPAAVAMTGSNSPVFPNVHARWIPLLEAVDRFGRSRGPVAAMVLNHGGPYKGSNWAFCGVMNRDLFDGEFPVMDHLFVRTCERLLGGAYLVTLKNGLACYRQGETASLKAIVAAASGDTSLAVRFFIKDEMVGEKTVQDGIATIEWPLPAEAGAFYECSAELCVGGKVVDRMRTGFSVWHPDVVASGPTVRFDANRFTFNGLPLFFGGANTSGMMWYSDNEDPLVWKRDFEQMGDFAMNTLRILHFSPFCKEENIGSKHTSLDLKHRPEELRRETDAIVQLSQPNQVSIFLSLHDWLPLDLSDEELRSQQEWNTFWANRYRNVPGMMYDIQNEPSTRLQNTEILRPLYESWLTEWYGSLPAALDAWKASGAAPKIDFSARPAGWDDLRVRDNERFRAWVYARWQKGNGSAVKSVDPHTPVTVGHLQNLTSSAKTYDTSGIDFLNVHHYGAVTHLRSVLKLIDRRFEGKSFSLGEFGSRTAHRARTAGEWGDPADESVRHYLAVGHYALGMGASFIANWSWKDFRDCVFPWGVNHADLTAKPVLAAYRNMMLLFRPVRLHYEGPELYLVLPDSLRFGAESGAVHEALRRAADCLISVNVPFGVINEDSLDRLPEGAKALVWPLAYCPNDRAFEHVLRFTNRGGKVLLSGDPRFDEARRPLRLERLKALGLPDDNPAPQSPFEMKELPKSIPMVRSASGNVCRIPLPLELLDGASAHVPGMYRRFIDNVSGVSRIKAVPDDGSVNVFDVVVEEGRMLVALNMAEEHQVVRIPVHGGYPEVTAGLDPGRTLTILWDKDGDITVAAAQGDLTVAGVLVLTGNSDCAFVSLDGDELRTSEQLMVLPFGEGQFGLNRADGAANLKGECGEFRNGRWTVLGKQGLSRRGSVARGKVDAVTAYDMRLLAMPEKQAAARENADRLLRPHVQ